MKSNNTKIFALLVSAVMLMAMLPSAAFANPDSGNSNYQNGTDKNVKPAFGVAEMQGPNSQVRAEKASGVALMNGTQVQDRDRIQYSKRLKSSIRMQEKI